jgi:integrase/recombinase XerD
MTAGSVRSTGPLAAQMDGLHDWLGRSGCSAARSVRCEDAFTRFSSWMADRHLGLADLDGDVIEEYIGGEQERIGSRTPAAFQYLPIARRYLTEAGVLASAGPVIRSRGGVPRLLAGPLAGVIYELVTWMKLQGYATGTVMSVAETAARLSAWMGTTALTAGDVSDELLERFVTAQVTGPVRHPSSAHRIVTVRKYLIACGMLGGTAAPPPPATPLGIELDAWGDWLRAERGIGVSSVADQRRWAGPFLAGLTAADGRIDWSQASCDGANRYVAALGSGYSLSSRRHLVTAVRSLLRWAFATGRVACPMSGGVLRPPPRRPGLPRGLPPAHVQAITAAADTSAVPGVRDLAVVMMFSRLGLRAGEVAGLMLDDVDWASGQLSVVGKPARRLTLPLPADVGAALVDYLRVRPASIDRAVFLRARPPLTRLTRQGISDIVARLAVRAGLGTVHAHRLRHSVATRVVTAGGSLAEARELLGHSHTDVTINYARTDLDSLRALKLTWGRMPS